MPNYEKMYYKLFDKITDLIIELQNLQRESEQIFIEQGKTVVLLYLDKKQEYQIPQKIQDKEKKD